MAVYICQPCTVFFFSHGTEMMVMLWIVGIMHTNDCITLDCGNHTDSDCITLDCGKHTDNDCITLDRGSHIDNDCITLHCGNHSDCITLDLWESYR